MCCGASMPPLVADFLAVQPQSFRDGAQKFIHNRVRGLWFDDEAARGEDPMLKLWPPGSSVAVQICYLAAGAVYAQSVTICNGISDPALKADCKTKARASYCEAIEACIPA